MDSIQYIYGKNNINTCKVVSIEYNVAGTDAK